MTVDDYLPVRNGNRLPFTKAYDGDIWVAIMEKVWAKVNGNYDHLPSGNPKESAPFFTSAPTEDYQISSSPINGSG